MSRYLILKASLEETGTGTMTVHGHSMEPIIESGATLEFESADEYEVGDIVFCKVRGRWIDAHKIVKKRITKFNREYLIANNRGHENGWTGQVYGRVTW